MGRELAYFHATYSPHDIDNGHCYVPTLGYPTGALDLYRLVDFVQTGHEDVNACMTDIDSCVGLSRVIEGPIQSARDLIAAESALQVLMWHERVDVLVPGYKAEHNGAFIGYARIEPERSQLSFDLFQRA